MCRINSIPSEFPTLKNPSVYGWIHRINMIIVSIFEKFSPGIDVDS